VAKHYNGSRDGEDHVPPRRGPRWTKLFVTGSPTVGIRVRFRNYRVPWQRSSLACKTVEEANHDLVEGTYRSRGSLKATLGDQLHQRHSWIGDSVPKVKCIARPDVTSHSIAVERQKTSRPGDSLAEAGSRQARGGNPSRLPRQAAPQLEPSVSWRRLVPSTRADGRVSGSPSRRRIVPDGPSSFLHFAVEAAETPESKAERRFPSVQAWWLRFCGEKGTAPHPPDCVSAGWSLGHGIASGFPLASATSGTYATTH